MRVLLNGLAATGARTGVGHYTSELGRCLRATTGVDVDCFPTGWLRTAKAAWMGLRTQLDRKAAVRTVPSAPRQPPRPGWLRRVGQAARRAGQAVVANRFRALARSNDYDLYHEPNFFPFACDLPTVTTIHDLSVLLHPEWHPADRVTQFEQHFRRGLDRSDHILTVSEFCRQEVIRTLGLPPDRVTRVYNGVRPGLRPMPVAEVRPALARLGLPPRYLLYVGTLEPRKNLLMLLRAYCGLPSRLREAYPLVLVGGWGWNAADLAAYLHDTARHRGVIHAGYLAEAHLPVVYNGARALVFPSYYEGFGLPPVEMLAGGGAVLASTADAVAETTGGKAHLIDPDDLEAWRKALREVIENEEWWQTLRCGATEAARPFTWERCAADTLGAYQRVLQKALRKAG
jgi:alpha-1,3-rhamnosyl/mannosyltransferase